MHLGVISDTHGLLRPEATRALRGVDLILHAGDVGGPEILKELEAIAPVTAVQGNTDWGAWTRDLQSTEVVEVDGRAFFILHDLEHLDLKPDAAGFSAVVSGHTHMPEIRWDRGVLYLNPGSAGPTRGSRPVTLARVRVHQDGLEPRILTLL